MEDTNRSIVTKNEFVYLLQNQQFQSDVSLRNDEIGLDAIELKDDLELKNLVFQDNLMIWNSVFKEVNIFNCEFDLLIFKDCVFKSNFHIYGSNFRNMVCFQNCRFENSLIIYNGRFHYLSFENSIVQNIFSIYGGNFSHLKYSPSNENTKLNIGQNFTIIDELKLSSKNGLYVHAKKCIINKINCEGFYNNNSRIYLIDVHNFDCSFCGVYNDGKIIIVSTQIQSTKLLLKDLEIDHIEKYKIEFPDEIKKIKTALNYGNEMSNTNKLFDQLNNYFMFTINDQLIELLKKDLLKANKSILLLEKPSLIIKNSSLGHFELNDINLYEYEITIFSTDLSMIKLVNSKFPIKNINSQNSLDKYNVYNDLYSSANKQSNVKDKIDYYCASQSHLKNHFQNEKKSFTNVFPIWTSKFYSNYGANWIKSLFTTGLLSILCFALLLTTYESLTLDPTREGFSYFANQLMPYIPEFLNPIHRIDFMESELGKIGHFTSLIDLLSRILLGIGIFETLRSFRKYVRN